ncbi:MAG: hypothetical protein JW806_06240 [Sedimentisphaerales bacterium]|nr:hypothetical protein [Sedimentisphaerales bacterium]
MKKAYVIVMWIAGLFLLVAGAMKVHQLLTEPIISEGFWESWAFFVIQVPLEIGLGIWLICGLFRKAAWLLATIAYGGFIVVTLYKAVMGIESCGCFGTVTVNPWITLVLIDVPIFLSLVIFRPKGQKLLPPPWPSAAHFFAIAIPTFILLPAIEYVLITNKQIKPTIEEVAIPQNVWPMLEYIDIKDQLENGLWVVLLYHDDCPDCKIAMPLYEQMHESLEGNDIHFAFVEMPPYGGTAEPLVNSQTKVACGRLGGEKKWYLQSPVVVVIDNGIVLKAWEADAPDFDTLLNTAFGQ